MPAVDDATRALREEILSARLPAGARLGEAGLAERFALSRTPVREALVRLAGEGLVELVPHRGARVVQWSRAQLEEVFELRLAVEPRLAALAVPRASAADLDALDDLAARMSDLAGGRPGADVDAATLTSLNRAFHDALADLAGHATMRASLRTVTHPALIQRNYHDYDAPSLGRSLAHHHELVAAARAGDAEWAEAVMRAHLCNARATMLADTSTAATTGAGR